MSPADIPIGPPAKAMKNDKADKAESAVKQTALSVLSALSFFIALGQQRPHTEAERQPFRAATSSAFWRNVNVVPHCVQM